MPKLVVYDSTYGNTRDLALAVVGALGDDARGVAIADATPADVQGLDLLVVGSPTQGGRPTAPIAAFLDAIPEGALRSASVAAFDTRIAAGEQNVALRLLMRVIGYAAPRVASALERKGGRLAAPPEGFIVDGKEGPLRAGERERAERWATGLRPGR
jgi:flavorubredoxin